jgi:hypothetical protein
MNKTVYTVYYSMDEYDKTESSFDTCAEALDYINKNLLGRKPNPKHISLFKEQEITLKAVEKVLKYEIDTDN